VVGDVGVANPRWRSYALSTLSPERRTAGPHGDRVHSYHESCTHRCADQRFRRSLATVDGLVMCSTSAGSYIGSYQLCRRYLVHVRLTKPFTSKLTLW
jgi:hypothetical protein